MKMERELEILKKDFLDEIASISDKEFLKDLESRFLGKKWKLKDILKTIKDLSIEEKKTSWVKANKLKEFFLEEIENKKREIDKNHYEGLEEKEWIDVSLEFPVKNLWHKHPISITTEILEEIFISLWFEIEDWPHIEDETHNFDKLNIPDNHPARDLWDTFWIWDEINKEKSIWERLLLRTHTSPVQIRVMEQRDLPIKIIVPWRVFRYEQEDARHTSNFYQLEWLVVWEWINFWNLKWTLETVMKKLLWDKTKLRFRPSIFPFTEPSVEIDVSCQICNGTWIYNWGSCKMCSGSSWVELLWAWMVHPDVLKWVSINSEKYSGFAFGMWIDRIASQRFWIDSSRAFYQSKLKLNEQF